MADSENRLRRISIPIPNPGLAQWLLGAQCRKKIEEVTAEIFVAYQNSLPVRTGNLRRGAYWRVGHGGFAGEQDRWFGWVGNRALSYRGKKGVPYAGFIEYGKNGKPGQHQLRNAAHLVFGGLDDVSAVNAVAERSTRTGHFGRGNTVHRSQGRNSLGRFQKKS